MKRFLFALCTIAFAAGAVELLPNREWSLSRTWNAQGSMVQNPDGSYTVTDTAGKGFHTFECSQDEYQVKGGQNYLLRCELTHANPNQKHTLLVLLPGARRIRKPELRTPTVSGNVVELTFRTAPDERRLAVYLSLFGTGTTQIRRVTLTPCAAEPDLLRAAGINWRDAHDKEGRGKFELKDRVLRITKSSAKGYYMVLPFMPIPIQEGKSYRVSMTLRCPAGLSAGLMINPGKRTSWPNVDLKNPDGSAKTLEQKFTALPGEKNLEVYAVIRDGTGTMEVTSWKIEETAAPPPPPGPLEGELLPQKTWRVNGKATCAKQPDGTLVINRTAPGETPIYFSDKYLPVEAGKSYRIRWVAEVPQGIEFYSITHTPPRKQWPAGARMKGTGKSVTVDQYLTIRTGENRIRPQLAFYGAAGKVTVRSLRVTEISAAELKAATAAGK